jgi:DNA-directed RNA polymerase II subunit RPB2
MNCDATMMYSSMNVGKITDILSNNNFSQTKTEKNKLLTEKPIYHSLKIKKRKIDNGKNVNNSLKTPTVSSSVEPIIEDINNEIKQLLSREKLDKLPNNEINALDQVNVLSNLGDYIEEPFQLIESYFQGKHLERLVRHQIESYNHFINYQIQKTIQMFNPVIVHSENDYIPEKEQYFLEIQIDFQNFKLLPPSIHENNGATKTMFPSEAKLRNFTYASNMNVDIHIKYIVRDTENMSVPKIIEHQINQINIGKMPIMLKSSICVLSQNKQSPVQDIGECHFDCGGYFIIKGSEKTVLGQERAAENRIYCFDGKNTTKWNWFAEIRSVPDFKCISPKKIDMMIASKYNGFGHAIFVTIPRIKQPIELFVVFRALGVISDKEICNRILLDVTNDKTQTLLNCLEASIVDANKYITQETALQHIISMVSYIPVNMDKDAGQRKKREFTIDILNNDLFPHCSSVPQKTYLLGYMAKRLLQTSLGWTPPDDRDSYLNKRIDLTGTLLNNLFRNYFNKLVKEMQKHILTEIKSRSWRTTEDYKNIINKTNIYKIIKSTTIENGINRALSTGDFSIKQANSSKVGVAQVLSRLTYLSGLSHLRRINTPLEKSGESIAPRKLHNTTWGFLCPVESPEGQSIGIVKNISYMAHITIPTNSSSLYEYVKPYIIHINDVESSEILYDKVKVFINGAWIGVAVSPIELYENMKEKKYKGIINIYTSIIFDFKQMEIRICNDGGRLTRPVLRVKDNKAIITLDIIRKLEKKEISWNDLLTNCVIPESVIEYIDPDQQNNAMIAIKSHKKNPSQKYIYTHCEIHPSTIFGILASCVPYPDHNQAPRNTYQCAMSKQAIGVYATNFDKRMDKTAYVMTYPSRPLVDTRLMSILQLNKIPSGAQIHVAIMTHTGYNQEDSVLINKGSIDRGMFLSTIYHTEKDEDKNIIRDEIIRCKPDKSKTKGIKFGNYDKLNAHGFIPENELVENRDVIIAKIVPIKENRNDPTKVIKFEDQSKTFRTTEETYIDKNYTGRNGDGYNFAKVRTRTLRKPTYGDKFACALPTQQVLTDKGWINMIDIDIHVHRVATLDSNGNMCYEHPKQKFEYEFDGELYSVETNEVKMICTLNHNMYIQTQTGKTYKLQKAGDIMGKTVRFQKSMKNVYNDIPVIHFGNISFNMDNWLPFLGAFISNGSVISGKKCIELSAHKKHNIEYIKQLLDNLEVKYVYDVNNGTITITSENYPILYDEMEKLSQQTLSKRLPDYIWDLSERQCRILMDSLTQNDGSVIAISETKPEYCGYYTINPELADDISRLATHCGWSGIIRVNSEPDEIISMQKQIPTYYSIDIIKLQNQPWINKKANDLLNVEKMIDYTGKVYCIEMPSSNLYYFRETRFSASLLSGNSKSGQKGTVGNIIPECDMPFTRTGLRPDLILNPHAIPSRMTIAHLKETLLGKVLVELGLFGDGTSFGDLSVKEICDKLQEIGYESYGNEIMYNGLNGQQIETSIFFGPTYYQRLKHMVNDKQHSRSIGPMVNLTRQAAEGRSKDGGLRIGEMERDVMLGHGMARFCRERLYESSDRYSVHVCKKCGMIASYNDGSKNSLYSKQNDFSIYHCNTCDNMTDFAKVEVPYAYKLLSQELQTINIVPRIITE